MYDKTWKNRTVLPACVVARQFLLQHLSYISDVVCASNAETSMLTVHQHDKSCVSPAPSTLPILQLFVENLHIILSETLQDSTHQDVCAGGGESVCLCTPVREHATLPEHPQTWGSGGYQVTLAVLWSFVFRR